MRTFPKYVFVSVAGNVSNQGNCDFEKGHGMCGFTNDHNDDFDWVFGSRNIQYYRQGPKTDHTTANTTGEGKPFYSIGVGSKILFQCLVDGLFA